MIISFQKYAFLFLVIAGLIFCFEPTYAQEKVTIEQVAVAEDSEVTVMKDDHAGQYTKATLENLSKLYWRLHVFDIDDHAAIDHYLMINECEIYQDYLNDDFEWDKIREATQKSITQNLDRFPLAFQFTLPIAFGRYDSEKGGFHLINNTAFKDMQRIEIQGNSVNEEICGKRSEIKDYPRNIILMVNKPFTYTFAEIDEHVAQAYILRKKYEMEKLPAELRISRYEREAFIRLRVSFSQYHGNIRGQGGDALAILYGTLEGIDVFEDSNEKRLLTSINYN